MESEGEIGGSCEIWHAFRHHRHRDRAIAITLEPRLIAQHAVRRPIDGRPNALIDLRTADGVRLVKGQWRYSDTTIVETDFNAPGPDLKPSGKPIKTYDYLPKAGSADFDDSKWEAIEPAALETRRSTGKLCFNWYRTSITIPERVGAFETVGATVVFEIVVDDYAEIWVDGTLPRTLGQTGGALVKGFNAPNRVVLTSSARPGQTNPTGDPRRQRPAVGSPVEFHLGPLGDA